MSKVDLTAFFKMAGMPDATDLAIKADAVRLVARGIQDRGMTQAEFGQLIGWKQPVVSNFIRGQLDLFGWTRVNEALAPFGKQVVLRPEITDLTASTGDEAVWHGRKGP